MLGLLVLCGFTLGLVYLRLSSGPLTFGGLPQRVASTLAERIGPGWSVGLRESGFELYEGALALHATDLQIRNPEGALVLKTPRALVSVDTVALLTGTIQPRAMEFRELQVRALLNADGSLAFSTSTAEEVATLTPTPLRTVPRPVNPQAPAFDPANAPAAANGPAVVSAPTGPEGRPEASAVSTAIVSLFETFVGPSGILGVLDEARLTNAHLTVVDAQGQERVTFRRADAAFSRSADGKRRFDSSLEGSGGVWHLSGQATPIDDGYRVSVLATDAPARDLQLIAGLSRLPATADLKVSGHADMVIAGGRVTQLSTKLRSGAGRIFIDDKDTTPQRVDETELDLAWEEARRTLIMRNLAFRGGGTKLSLNGELRMEADSLGWSATVSGENGVLEGVLPDDAPVVLDRIEANLSGREGLVFDKLVLRGPTLTVDLSGTYGTAADPGALQVQGLATRSAVRSILRIWPEAVTPPVRRFMVTDLKGGTVETMNLAVSMSSEDLKKATSGGPIPDTAAKVDFALRDVELATAEGLPPLAQAQASGTVTGTKVNVVAPTGRVTMPDGRVLNASGGAFSIPDYWSDTALAKIAFRMEGGADALGSLLQAPLMREVAGVEVDPATLKGRVDLRVALPLAVKNLPKFADLPFTVAGTIGDFSVEKVFGNDRLEGANLTVNYDRGNLAIRGDGRLAGSAAQIDVRQLRGQGGEASIVMTLDEAARARKGMSLGAQLTGPVGVRAAVPIGRPDKPGTRIEIDLARATVNHAIPGWTKPAGRPGKLSFVLADAHANELKDVVLDAGPTQLKGTITLSDDGGLDKADLPTFKLSQGDDMRAQVERANGVYRVTLRGNTGDMRPFIRMINASTPSAPAPAQRAGSRDGGAKDRDFDVDLALNIMTGNNDEAVTNAIVKLQVRASLLRQLELKGRLGSTALTGQTVSRGNQNFVVVQGEDAGAVLRFFDVYRRMFGGELYLQLATGEAPQDGFLSLSRFTLRNEPALSRIIPTQSQTVVEGPVGKTRNVQIDVNEVAFTRAQVAFSRTYGRLDLKDAVISGNEVGFTLSGMLDLPRDRVDINGTFVPAYALNNAFAQVPLLGPLLGGGRNEGLFGVTFRITGQATAPALNVNPLSAVAPGFLRKIFGGIGAPAEPGAPAPQFPSTAGDR
jgi:hypothetical protein